MDAGEYTDSDLKFAHHYMMKGGGGLLGVLYRLQTERVRELKEKLRECERQTNRRESLQDRR